MKYELSEDLKFYFFPCDIAPDLMSYSLYKRRCPDTYR